MIRNRQIGVRNGIFASDSTAAAGQYWQQSILIDDTCSTLSALGDYYHFAFRMFHDS